MLRAKQHEGGAEDGVDARREHIDRGRGIVLERKGDPRALGAADPVPLHHGDFLRPRGQRLEAAQQLIPIGRDAEEPLFEIARDDGRTGLRGPGHWHIRSWPVLQSCC